MTQTTTIGKYLIQRLEETGLRHVFGIPGDYVLGFFDLLEASRMKIIGTCTEAGAGFAGDAYARVNGVGCICVTYCVGGLNTLNAVAGAYAEKSPLIVITGAPGVHERVRSPLLHHRVRDFNTQRKIFEQVTVASCALEDAKAAPEQIDETIAACLRHKRPVFIEIPRDMVDAPCAAPRKLKREPERSDPHALAEALAEATAMLRSARRPVVLGGVEIHRFGIQDKLLALIDKTGLPIATTMLGKSIIGERHDRCLGVYEGAMGRESVRKHVDNADCLLILGALMTDINLGGFTAHIDEARTIHVTSELVSIRYHHFDHVTLADFIVGLTRGRTGRLRGRIAAIRPHKTRPFTVKPRKATTIRRFFDRINHFLDDETMVIADVGDSMFGATDLTIHRRTEFLSPAYYASMGFAVPAALGAQIGAPERRPVVLVGDGAFQMTGPELSSIARYGLNPIVFVLNNRGYTTERFIHEGPYNDVHEWAYHLWPQIVGKGWGCQVRTEGELEEALAQARGNRTSFSIINVHLEPYDRSFALERLSQSLRAAAKLKA